MKQKNVFLIRTFIQLKINRRVQLKRIDLLNLQLVSFKLKRKEKIFVGSTKVSFHLRPNNNLKIKLKKNYYIYNLSIANKSSILSCVILQNKLYNMHTNIKMSKNKSFRFLYLQNLNLFIMMNLCNRMLSTKWLLGKKNKLNVYLRFLFKKRFSLKEFTSRKSLFWSLKIKLDNLKFKL